MTTAITSDPTGPESSGGPSRPKHWWHWLTFFPIRVVYFVGLIILFSAILPSMGGWATDVSARGQWLLAWGLVLSFAIVYRGFLGRLLRYLVEHPVQSIILTLLLLILYGLTGVSYGLPSLFWHEYPAYRFFTALGVTLLLAVLGWNAYYFDRRVDETMDKVQKFLVAEGRGVDYQGLLQRSLDWLIPRDEHAKEVALLRGRLTLLWFWLMLLRPWLTLPIYILRYLDSLEPRDGPAKNISLFLRLARLPFLTLVSLPVIFPLAFPYVPRYAPITGVNPLIRILEIPDVGRNGWAWAFGLFVWGAGVFSGIFVVKALIYWGSDWKTTESGAGFMELPVHAQEFIEWVILGLAVGLTFVDAITGFLTLSEGRLWPWLLFVVDAAAILVAFRRCNRLAALLHPDYWPPYLRFLRVVAAVLVFLLLFDRLAQYLDRPQWAIWPGLALYAVLAVMFVLEMMAGFTERPRRAVENIVLRLLLLCVVWVAVMLATWFLTSSEGRSWLGLLLLVVQAFAIVVARLVLSGRVQEVTERLKVTERLIQIVEWLILGHAVILTTIDAATGFLTLSEGRSWPSSLLFVVDAAAIVVALFRCHRFAGRLYPHRWPTLLRFLGRVAGPLLFLLLFDRLIQYLGLQPLTIPPGLALCVVFAVLSVLGTWFHMLRTRSVDEKWVPEEKGRIRWALPVFLGITAWIGLVNNQDYKLQFPHLDYIRRINLKRKLEEIYPEVAKADLPRELDQNNVVLNRWVEVAQKARTKAQKKPKLVVVCVSGGASRAAYWTAVVLDRLGRDLNGFDEAVRIITGASGGMVGAAYYVNNVNNRLNVINQQGAQAAGPTVPEALVSPWVCSIATDGLNPIAKYVALEGMFRILLPRFPWLSDKHDRGVVLDWDWKDLDQLRFRTLRSREEAGEIPSLIFTPVIVDDGRRLLISNLDLHDIVVNRGHELHSQGNAERSYSLAGLEFFKLFEGCGGDELRLSTAARMSASFPFVSPAVNLPCDPPLRVVDGGYYDNYGVNLAAAWIARYRKELKEKTDGVLLVQIRAFLGRAPRLAPPQESSGVVSDLLRGVEFFTTPIDAFSSGRYTGSVFRNDQELSALMEVMNKDHDGFFATVVFENSALVQVELANPKLRWPGSHVDGNAAGADLNTEVAMTWYLTRTEKLAMNWAIPSDDLACRTKLKGDEPETSDKPVKDSFLECPVDRLRWLRTLYVRVRDRRERLERTISRGGKESDREAAERSYDEKELERALNYERIQAIRAWW